MGNRGSSVQEIPQVFTETQNPQVNNLGLINTETFINYNKNNFLIFNLFILLFFILIFFSCYIKK
jgi:hypothetical protein